MKLINLFNKVTKYSSSAAEFNKIELYSKKINDLKLLSSYINNNFKIKKSGLYNYIPKEDSYRMRMIIENNRYSQEYTKMIQSFAYNNKMKTAIINHETFVDHPDYIAVSNIKEVKPLLSMFDINLKKNLFKRDSFAYSYNSNDFNDICGNYINFVRKKKNKHIKIIFHLNFLLSKFNLNFNLILGERKQQKH